MVDRIFLDQLRVGQNIQRHRLYDIFPPFELNQFDLKDLHTDPRLLHRSFAKCCLSLSSI